MKQQINLYLPEFRRKKDPLGFDNLHRGSSGCNLPGRR